MFALCTDANHKIDRFEERLRYMMRRKGHRHNLFETLRIDVGAGFPRGRKDVVCFIEHNPMGPASASAKIEQVEKQALEIERSILKFYSDDVSNNALPRLFECVKYFGIARRTVNVSKTSERGNSG